MLGLRPENKFSLGALATGGARIQRLRKRSPVQKERYAPRRSPVCRGTMKNRAPRP